MTAAHQVLLLEMEPTHLCSGYPGLATPPGPAPGVTALPDTLDHCLLLKN